MKKESKNDDAAKFSHINHLNTKKTTRKKPQLSHIAGNAPLSCKVDMFHLITNCQKFIK